MILIQETNIKLNLFEFSILSTDNSLITKVVLSMVISIILIKGFHKRCFQKHSLLLSNQGNDQTKDMEND